MNEFSLFVPAISESFARGAGVSAKQIQYARFVFNRARKIEQVCQRNQLCSLNYAITGPTYNELSSRQVSRSNIPKVVLPREFVGFIQEAQHWHLNLCSQAYFIAKTCVLISTIVWPGYAIADYSAIFRSRSIALHKLTRHFLTINLGWACDSGVFRYFSITFHYHSLTYFKMSSTVFFFGTPT